MGRKKRILLLTQYFPPETGAPQNRLSALALFLHSAYEVEVLTCMPNYPALELFEAYKGKEAFTENWNDIQLHRVEVFVGGKGFVNRLKTYFSFMNNASKFSKSHFKEKKFDIIFCESPPLFLGITALQLSKKFNAKLVMNISDLWPESVEKLEVVTNKFILAPFYWLEKYLYRKSALITGQTQGIVDSVKSKLKNKAIPVLWYPNGIAVKELQLHAEVPESVKAMIPKGKKILLYAGNFGFAQGLDIILKAASNLKSREELHFILIGDGPERENLLELKYKLGLENCDIYRSISRKELFSLIQLSFAYIVPLKRIELFLGAIPSKIFEPLAMGVPVLLGVDGEARRIFCEDAKAAKYFTPENVEDLSQSIVELLENEELRNAMIAEGKALINGTFDRDNIQKKLQKELDLL